jgi:hypothetical protein
MPIGHRADGWSATGTGVLSGERDARVSAEQRLPTVAALAPTLAQRQSADLHSEGLRRQGRQQCDVEQSLKLRRTARPFERQLPHRAMGSNRPKPTSDIRHPASCSHRREPDGRTTLQSAARTGGAWAQAGYLAVARSWRVDTACPLASWCNLFWTADGQPEIVGRQVWVGSRTRPLACGQTGRRSAGFRAPKPTWMSQATAILVSRVRSAACIAGV